MLMLTKEEALEFRERWRLVNARTAKEISEATPEQKLRATAIMFEAAQVLGWADRLAQGEAEVRERWIKLRERVSV